MRIVLQACTRAEGCISLILLKPTRLRLWGQRRQKLDTSKGSANDDASIRRSSGSIDREDALTPEEVRAAIAAGRRIADEEVDWAVPAPIYFTNVE